MNLQLNICNAHLRDVNKNIKKLENLGLNGKNKIGLQ